MIESSVVEGSYRDPSGRIFSRNKRIFRTVTEHGLENFEYASATGLLDELVGAGVLVPWTEVDDVDLGPEAADARKILEHRQLSFVSYPYEWSFSGLKAAALLHLDIQIRALGKSVALSDASAYNIQFEGPRPIFIDHLSFRPYRDGEFWLGHRQFCDQFLNPLLMWARLGIPHNTWFRGSVEGIPATALSAMLPWHSRLRPKVLTHVVLPAKFEQGGGTVLGNKVVSRAMGSVGFSRRSFARMLESLRRWISGLRPTGVDDTVWSSYVNDHNYTDREVIVKRAFVADFAAATKPSQIWDMGCNTGDYSKVALESGASYAIGFESDVGVLEKAFNRAVSENLNLLPLFLDAANPSPAQGWSQCERFGLQERRSAEGLLALAVLHHLCVGRNVPLPDAVSWLIGHAPCGVIEFVPKRDLMVQELLRLREDVFDFYTEEIFDRAVADHARIVKSEVITESGRKLVWYDRS